MKPRPVWPALLSVGASMLPFVTAWALERPNACCSEDTGERLVQSISSVFLGVVLLFVSIAEFVDGDHHQTWGSIVAGLYGFYGAVIFGDVSFKLLLSSYTTTPLEVLQLLVPVAGFLGGILGVFWKTGWKMGASVAAFAGPARLALIGGSNSLVLLVPFLLYLDFPGPLLNGPVVLSTPAALLTLASGVALYRTKWRPRVLGAMIVGGSLTASLPFFLTVIVSFYAPSYYFYPSTAVRVTWAYFVLAGTIPAVIGGVQAIRRKQQPN